LVFDIILHTAYTVDACAPTSILPSLFFIDMIYFTADTKATPASASIFRLIWISLLHNVVSQLINRTERFRCVFGSKNGLLNVRRILRISLCAYPLYTTLSQVGFSKFWASLG
jgi:hypothetical protein